MDFFTLFVAPVVGKKWFENLCWCQKLSDFVTVSDEALALLIFENNYDRWIDMGKRNNWTSSIICPKYTTGGNAVQTPNSTKFSTAVSRKTKIGNPTEGTAGSVLKESTCAKHQGWSIEGIKRYNQYFDAVKAEQQSQLGCDFEEAFLQYSIGCKHASKKKPKRETFVFKTCRHKLWDEEEKNDTNDCEDIQEMRKDTFALLNEEVVVNYDDNSYTVDILNHALV